MSVINGTNLSVDTVTTPSGDVDTRIDTAIAGGHSGQTWQNVTASRALDTNYVNSTGKPISVLVTCTAVSANDYMKSYVDGTLVLNGSQQGLVSGYFTEQLLIPDGATYQVRVAIGATLTFWKELR